MKVTCAGCDYSFYPEELKESYLEQYGVVLLCDECHTRINGDSDKPCCNGWDIIENLMNDLVKQIKEAKSEDTATVLRVMLAKLDKEMRLVS